MTATRDADAGHDAVLLVSHGTVDDLDDLPAFVTNVRRGHAPSPDLIAELRRRYEAIGGRSPLNDVSARLASKLEERLGVRTTWANRLWKPAVRDVLQRLEGEGVRTVAVVPLAPHSAHVYADDARRAAEGTGLTLACASSWGDRPKLHDAFAARLREELEPGQSATVVMTAHSLPRSAILRGDPYERDVRACAAAVAQRLGDGVRTTLAFQSQGMGAASGSGDWLGPDLPTVIGDAAARGERRIVCAPIGFLADHVEILYDLDIEAAALARTRGIEWSRARSLNADDDFVEVLADVARPLLDHG
jgi:ferrochelatase